ncbi:hypothetical protein SmJEL517_g06027 [Synchytrium microbalum]|uniref:D-isomer specific 2-hydroxyacid dehydrogenase NAD-binding domain-containing protein n=1 Tax=Synchytrium microbalum TaxID=1806994 RepID=A0A507BTK2_9FUNG|nr:uncharacterized protein SmJEL517_g06027 [Synchytrium microbalum]TPX30409.1 hypothetical protein SmJEL517_g06027 [Synchytrium microbalum]
MAFKHIKILILGHLSFSTHIESRLASTYTLLVADEPTRADFLESCRSGKYDRVKVIIKTLYGGVRVTDSEGVDAEWLDAVGRDVELVVSVSAGYEDCDVDEMTRRGILLTKAEVSTATADITMFLLLATFRNTHTAQKIIREGTFKESFRMPKDLGNDPKGKTLGILGYGCIGKDVTKKAQAFGMNVIYYKRTRLPAHKEKELGIHYVSFDELISTSHCISVHVPLSAESRHMIGDREFEMMRDGVRIVNTARGAIINESALMNALKTGKVFAAGLDVFEHEPHVPDFLRNHPRVTAICHIGGASVETLEEYESQAMDNVDSFVTRGVALTPVNYVGGKNGDGCERRVEAYAQYPQADNTTDMNLTIAAIVVGSVAGLVILISAAILIKRYLTRRASMQHQKRITTSQPEINSVLPQRNPTIVSSRPNFLIPVVLEVQQVPMTQTVVTSSMSSPNQPYLMESPSTLVPPCPVLLQNPLSPALDYPFPGSGGEYGLTQHTYTRTWLE